MGGPTTRPRIPNFIASTEFDRLIALETDDCLIWPYDKTNEGYGRVCKNGRRWTVHVLALTLRIGPRPSGMIALHAPIICHNPLCMNYRHLRWGTDADNAADRSLDGTHRWMPE